MRPIVFALLAFLCSCIPPASSYAQVLDPVQWTVSANKKNVKAGDEIELVFKGTIDENWYVYANEFDPECGPIPVEFEFNKTNSFTLAGIAKAINSKDKHDEIFGCDVKIFLKAAELRQKIKVLGSPLQISGALAYQVCSNITGQCVAKEYDFSVSGFTVTGASNAIQKSAEKPVDDKPDNQKTTVQDSAKAASNNNDATPDKGAAAFYAPIKGPVLDPSILEGEPEYNSESLWALLALAFVAGLAALITPCVFPMIPMTVTFFMKDTQSKKEGIKKAIIFGLSIVLLYTTAGTLFAIVLGVDGLNALATNWALNLFIFFVFIIFALSFFGLFDINAPYKLVNKIDRQAEKGGLIGVFFMAFTLVLISFSCTVPIVSTVLALSAGGQIIKPALMMFSYSVAFAFPFAFFAFFPEVIKSLPKSGGWLNSVKVTLGFLELALAFKFFSIADQTYHWGLLDRDINIALWVVIFALLGFYLLGKIRLPHDSPVEKISVARLIMSICVFSFVIYLIPGLWGAPLKALAGYLPPQSTHDFDLVSLGKNGKQNEICDDPKYADFLHLPHGLNGYFDYEQAMACARRQNKPLFIDFTGHGCVNCREMEANVWADPQVLNILKNDYVVVALYVDDKTLLPESEWYTSEYDNKEKKTIGKQNADLQIRKLKHNAQPFYVLVGSDEKVLAWPKAYDKSVENFKNFLESGKKTYNRLYANRGSYNAKTAEIQ